jgi:hypothetical protein
MDNLENNTTISGYVHPKQVNSTRNSIYKTFSCDDGNKKSKKNQSFGKNTLIGNSYSTNYISKKDDIDDICPVCKNIAVHICSCVNSDKKCEQEHVWYTNRSGELVVGNPHSKQ